MLTLEEFETIIEEALKDLPPEFTEKMENIDILVEELPHPDLHPSLDLRKKTLLGLYVGIPHPQRGPSYGNTLPDRIYLFKKNLEAFCKTREELKEQIQRTVLHEIGHYFGMSDLKLRELGF